MTISEYIASGRNVEKLNLDDINYLKNDETVKPMLKYLGNKMVDLLIERGLSESDKSEYLKGKMNATLEIIKEFEGGFENALKEYLAQKARQHDDEVIQ